MSLLYYSYTACCFDSFSFIFVICRIISRFKKTREVLFQCYVQRLFSVDKHIVLLEEKKARYPEFDHDCFEVADMDNSECKVNFILKT